MKCLKLIYSNRLFAKISFVLEEDNCMLVTLVPKGNSLVLDNDVYRTQGNKLVAYHNDSKRQSN